MRAPVESSMNEQVPFEEAGRWSTLALAVWMRRRWLALACLAVPLSALAAAVIFLPDRYRSAALVEVEAEPGAVAGEPPAVPIEGQLQRLNEQNLSRAHLKELISRFELYPELRRRGSSEAAIDQMRRDIQIENKDADHVWGHGTVAFQVSFRGRNPERVAEVTNTLASFYVERSREQQDLQAKNTVARLLAQSGETKLRLDAEEKDVNDFITLHLQELPEQVRVNLARLDRLNTELVLSSASRRRSPGERDLSSAAPESARLDGQELELARLGDELSGMRGKATELHPDVVRLKVEIAALAAASPRPRRRQAAQTAAALPDPELAELRSLEDDKRLLKQTIAATEQKVFNAPKREQELQALLTPYQATRQLYASQLGRLKDARFAAGFERQHALAPFRILDPAVASHESVAPDRLRIAAAGIFLSLLLALFVVLVAEKLDTSFHSLDELRAFSRVPVLVSVPDIVAPRDTIRLARRARAVAFLVVFAAGASAAGTWALVHDNEPLVLMLVRSRA
jgi:polysaccharide biosynthesis transport protein